MTVPFHQVKEKWVFGGGRGGRNAYCNIPKGS